MENIEKLPSLKIGNYELDVPIIQGGMSIKVAGKDLVKAVADYGAMGTLGGVAIGYGVEEYKNLESIERDRQALRDILQKMKSPTEGTNGIYGINLLTAINDYNELVKIATENEVKFIVSGAGLPLDLPLLTSDHPEVALIPIVSSVRALKIICERWWSKSERLPDAFIIEAPATAGGHLGATPRKGFTMEQRIYDEELKLENVAKGIKDYFNEITTISPETINHLEETFREGITTKKELKQKKMMSEINDYLEKNNIKKIPLIAAGGIWDRSDIDHMLGLGFDGVQMATRFVCTPECDVSPQFKQKYIDSTKDDIVNFMSPLGLYGRAIRTPFLDDLINGKPPARDNIPCLDCLNHCSKRVCLADILNKAYNGDVENGIVFAGSNAYRSKEKGIMTVQQIFDEIIDK